VLAVSNIGGDLGTWRGRRGGELPRVQDEDEDDDVSFVFIHAKGYSGRDGLCWANVDGLLGGLPRPGKGPGGFPPLFLLSVFFFYFIILF
jgi:hypothetical protein